MGSKKERYRLVRRKENDGPYSFEEEMVVTRDVLEIIGEEELENIRKKIKKSIKIKKRVFETIYGDSNTFEAADIYTFPEEIYFKNKAGAIISLTAVEAKQITNSPQDLYLVGKHNPENEPLLLKTRDPEEVFEELLEAPYLVQFRADLDFQNE